MTKKLTSLFRISQNVKIDLCWYVYNFGVRYSYFRQVTTALFHTQVKSDPTMLISLTKEKAQRKVVVEK